MEKSVNEVSDRFSAEIIEALNVIGKSKNDNTEAYQEAEKLVNARIANLESNLHIEIDMERVEDRSKALSYIGIEIADALKLIPTPVAEEPKVEEVAEQAKVEEAKPQTNNVKVANTNVVPTQPVQNKTQAYENFYSETRTEVKSSLWNKFKNSKFVRAVKYALKIRVVLQLPEALPEGNSDGMRK